VPNAHCTCALDSTQLRRVIAQEVHRSRMMQEHTMSNCPGRRVGDCRGFDVVDPDPILIKDGRCQRGFHPDTQTSGFSFRAGNQRRRRVPARDGAGRIRVTESPLGTAAC
jgi:hypothetical protein